MNLFKLSFQSDNFILAVIRSFKDEQSAISFGLSYAKKHDYKLLEVEQIWYADPNLKHQYNMWKFKKRKNKLVR